MLPPRQHALSVGRLVQGLIHAEGIVVKESPVNEELHLTGPDAAPGLGAVGQHGEGSLALNVQDLSREIM